MPQSARTRRGSLPPPTPQYPPRLLNEVTRAISTELIRQAPATITSPRTYSTPQKARPPARLAPRHRRIPHSDEDEEEDDPLAVVVLDSPLANLLARERNEDPQRTPRARQGPLGTLVKGARRRHRASRRARRHVGVRSTRSCASREDDLRALDIELHTYTAVGPASGRTRKGFLAHGGGGGVPVFIGTEMVETGDDELEIIGTPSPRPPPRRKKIHPARR
ncbi:hypothetical protein V8E53_003266 [Lactarius tabidus]